ncbi:hypothetical protein ACFXHA_40130 [Nocardia sp. NPDC059240]|uniref:hypothetical protein n=1 Tax=Nocardia sp. NPDC059240 TaxID=3346786 RepID=UPI0036C9E6E0
MTSGQDAGANPAAPSFYYLMRNECSVGGSFRVYQHTLGRDAVASIGGGSCQWVNAHDTATFWDPVGDSDWEPLACPVASAAALADPGRCGVSVEGPSSTGTGFAYFVRNDCSAPVDVKVHMYTVDQYTACKWIEPGETVALLSNYVDQNWQAEGC